MLRSRMLRRFMLAVLATSSGPAAAEPNFRLHSELSGWRETGRYAEVEQLCANLPAKYPQAVRCFEFGRTPEGRPLLAFAVGANGYLEAQAQGERPVVAFQGGIHAGEIDGKDAGFIFIRDILERRILPGILDRVTLLFVPVLNVDGHERFGPNQRPNQNGPEMTGWRTTAQNFNLNRDYLKAEAPEMQNLLTLFNAWDPVVYLDLHVTNGAKFQHDIAVIIDPASGGLEMLRRPAAELRDRVMRDLERAGHLPLWFYPSFEKADDPMSGVRHGPSTPRFSHGYYAFRNRIGVLVETHSWRPFQHRVASTYQTLLSIVGAAGEQGAAWRQAATAADRFIATQAGKPQVLSFRNTDKATPFTFQGYAYTRELSEVSGQLMTRYDPSKPQVWQLPLRSEVVPQLIVAIPKGGYLIPPAYKEIIQPKLVAHGIRFEELPSGRTIAASVYRARDVKLAGQSSEGRQRADYQGEWQPRRENLPAGSLFVPAEQSRILLAMHLLEPASPDSLLAWGFFNEIFERKEYMEPYVAEEEARKMLKDPRVQREFSEKLKDPDFAQDPAQRLDFFYRRHPSFDQAWNRYPILRTEENPSLLHQVSGNP